MKNISYLFIFLTLFTNASYVEYTDYQSCFTCNAPGDVLTTTEGGGNGGGSDKHLGKVTAGNGSEDLPPQSPHSGHAQSWDDVLSHQH